MYITWLDSNSWLIEMGGQRILLDPWLVGTLVFGNLPWFFKGSRSASRPIPENIDLILLSQGLEDHAHPATLQELDRNIPVVASPNAAKVVRQLGYNQVTVLEHEESFTLAEKVKIQAKPGSLVGPMLVENGYLLVDLINSTTLYYEPHGNHSPSLKNLSPVDVVITPIIDIEIPFVGPIIKGQKSAIQLIEWLKPQVIIPTAANGDLVFEGLLMSLLRSQGDANEFRNTLAKNNLKTELVEPLPGERFELKLSQSAGMK
jgi:L-ascorbate metabolism protein UlaG (beta-lactamase superfamily)